MSIWIKQLNRSQYVLVRLTSYYDKSVAAWLVMGGWKRVKTADAKAIWSHNHMCQKGVLMPPKLHFSKFSDCHCISNIFLLYISNIIFLFQFSHFNDFSLCLERTIGKKILWSQSLCSVILLSTAVHTKSKKKMKHVKRICIYSVNKFSLNERGKLPLNCLQKIR